MLRLRCLACSNQSDSKFIQRSKKVPPEISLDISLLNSKLQKFTKSCILPQRKPRSVRNSKFRLVRQKFTTKSNFMMICACIQTQVINVNTRDNMNTRYFDLLRELSYLWGQIANQNKQKLIFQGQITILIQYINTWTFFQNFVKFDFLVQMSLDA